MGVFAERSAQARGFAREAQDAFAREIVAVAVSGRGGEQLLETDEQPGKARPEKIPSLRSAFAAVAMIAAEDLAIPAERLNVNGGATALGHPIGASGARILATLIAALQNRRLRRGVASLCIGGGEATAVAVELN